MSAYNAYKMSGADGLPPKMPSKVRRDRTYATKLGGAASIPQCEGGRNLSPRRMPDGATRPPRGLLLSDLGEGEPHGLVAFGGDLYFVRGTVLYRMDSDAVISLGTVSDTDKRFFVFEDRLYIFPDKLYVQAGEVSLRSMEIDSGEVSGAVFRGSTVTLPDGMTWTGLGFRAGDCLRVVNADMDLPAPEGYYRIKHISGREATLVEKFSAVSESTARFCRVVPDLDRVCVNGDRVYGVAGKAVYVSAVGSPLDFYSGGDGDGRGGAILQLSSEGNITACAAWQGYVVFFKEDSICKLLGTRSDSFTLQERPAVGVSERLADTVCEVGGALYYLNERGVYRYGGQEPERISALGGMWIGDGIGGTDGAAYYLALNNGGNWRQYCYLPEERAWFPEDGMHPRGMVCRNGFLCIQDGAGDLWLTSSDGRDPFCLSDEQEVLGPVRSSLVLPPDYEFQPEGCRLTGVFVRATGREGSVLEVFADFADGLGGGDANGVGEVSLGVAEGGMTDRLFRFPVVPHSCDGVRIRLDMTGEWVIHGVIREYEV